MSLAVDEFFKSLSAPIPIRLGNSIGSVLLAACAAKPKNAFLTFNLVIEPPFLRPRSSGP
jgi:hypothetical protein